MEFEEGKFTVETFARQQGLERQSALNLLSKLKKQNLVKVTGGGSQKRIYTVSKIPLKEANGFFTILNKYSPEKINPSFEHHVYGKYGVERALIDGILFQKSHEDIRVEDAMIYLFKNIKDWKLVFRIAKEKNITNEVHKLYDKAKHKIKCRTMPKRYVL